MISWLFFKELFYFINTYSNNLNLKWHDVWDLLQHILMGKEARWREVKQYNIVYTKLAELTIDEADDRPV